MSAAYLVRRTIGTGRSLVAILFQSVFAVITFPATVHQATHGCLIAYFEFFYMTAHCGYNPYYLMTRYTGIDRIVPFIANGVQVTVANTTVLYVYLYILRMGFSSFNG